MPATQTKPLPKISPIAFKAGAAQPNQVMQQAAANQGAYNAQQAQQAPPWYNPSGWFGGQPMAAAEAAPGEALELIKAHPIAAAGVAIGVVVLAVKAFARK